MAKRPSIEQDVTLEMPTIPLTTFRRNSRGSKFSEGRPREQDRAEKIFEEMMSGSYECPICSDAIYKLSPMWSCRECHHVYHFGCIQKWAKNANFNCPTCKAQTSKHEVRTAKCWCLKNTWINCSYSDAVGNTCGDPCNRLVVCKSEGMKCQRLCEKICHPGPCEKVVCRDDCPTKGQLNAALAIFDALGVEEETVPDRHAGDRHSRRGQRPRLWLDGARESTWTELNLYGAIGSFLVLIMLQVSLIIWALTSSNKRVYPLEHLDYTQKLRDAEYFCSVFFGCSIFGIASGFFALMFCHYIVNLTRGINMGGHFCGMLKVLIYLCFFALTIVVTLDFPVLFFGLPVTVWNNNMKLSRTGFDTRVGLDGNLLSKTYVYDPSHLTVSRDTLPVADTILKNFLEALDHVKDANPLILFNHVIDERAFPWEAFHDFYRMGGVLLDNEHRAVDFDLKQNAWRVVQFSKPATTVRLDFIRNGTWTKATSKDPHARFPELDLVAPKFHHFTTRCQHEGFMTFFNTDGMTEEEILKQANEDWSPKSGGNVVMRTVNQALGFHISKLEVLAKRPDYEFDGEKKKGLGDDFVVPMGLMAILRHQKLGGDVPPDCPLF